MLKCVMHVPSVNACYVNCSIYPANLSLVPWFCHSYLYWAVGLAVPGLLRPRTEDSYRGTNRSRVSQEIELAEMLKKFNAVGRLFRNRDEREM